jgi:hypothetical protein
VSEDITFEVDAKGRVGYKPPQRPAGDAPRPLVNRAREKQDEMRRPQAAHVFRMLRERHAMGASWAELWALGEGNEEWAVGPIIVWLRAHNVEVVAEYDVTAGETRFYLAVPLADVSVP